MVCVLMKNDIVVKSQIPENTCSECTPGVETNARPLARGEWKSLGMSTNLSAVVPRRVHNMRFFTPVYPLITYYSYPIYALT